MPTSPAEMMAAIILNLPEKTGKDIEEWKTIVRADKVAQLASRKDKIAYLQRKYGLGHGQAQTILWEAEKPDDYVPPGEEELLAEQYAGAKHQLLPIAHELIAAALALGGDVSIETRKTYVSLVRRRQFALVQPTTRTKVDLGLVLPGREPAERLRPAGSFGSGRTTHRVTLTSADEVDDEVHRWLRAAYASEAD
jgi:hypothetical protein